MIRLRLHEKLLDHSAAIGRRLELGEVANATGIHRTTLSKMINKADYSCTTANLDLLCKYFDCPLSDLARYEADSAAEEPARSARQTSTRGKIDKPK